LSPFLAKESFSCEKLKEGAGMLDNTSLAMDILPSIRPVFTLQKGPPLYKMRERKSVEFHGKTY